MGIKNNEILNKYKPRNNQSKQKKNCYGQPINIKGKLYYNTFAKSLSKSELNSTKIKMFKNYDNFTDEWKSRNFKKIEENTSQRIKPSTSESKSRCKKNIGNIETFLKRHYGQIHNPQAYDRNEENQISKITSEFNTL